MIYFIAIAAAMMLLFFIVYGLTQGIKRTNSKRRTREIQVKLLTRIASKLGVSDSEINAILQTGK